MRKCTKFRFVLSQSYLHISTASLNTLKLALVFVSTGEHVKCTTGSSAQLILKGEQTILGPPRKMFAKERVDVHWEMAVDLW